MKSQGKTSATVDIPKKMIKSVLSVDASATIEEESKKQEASPTPKSP